ncbi:MAG: pantoate--beta-alanine ligase [Bacteroidales bacterium]|nr:pantoate--beta-alanine ligase [Bacteroidales bacterium]
MKVIAKIDELKKVISEYRNNGKSIGLVPTMGALHDGHISLVKRCLQDNECCVVSIFVNPTQFNDKNDLKHYPRTPKEDCELLESVGCTIVFTPEVEEMYPEEDTRIFDLGSVANVMEGKFRPGHFNGVAQIVSKLFYAVEPDKAYFGEKDFQQIAVIRAMERIINTGVEIIDVPIVRENDGLAMSSRNRRLTETQRKNAPKIWETLSKSYTFAQSHSVEETINFVVDSLNSIPEFKVEYYEIVNAESLQPITNWESNVRAVGCIAVFCGEIRLIDNISYCVK